MPKYLLTGEMTISVHVTVEADSEEEAIEKAQDCPPQSFCYHCSHGSGDEWCTSGELDGEVNNIRAQLDE